MEAPLNVLQNLSNVHYFYFSENTEFEYNKESEALALKFLRIFGIKKDTNKILYFKDIFFEDKKQLLGITPFPHISQIDIESLEDILNSCPQTLCLSPLFDAIGWTISNSTGKVKMEFIGGFLYDSWKDSSWNDDFEDMDWKEDLDSSDLDWKAGGGWQDGYHLDTLSSPYWKHVEEKDKVIP